MNEPAARLRIDKWLWHARVTKTRSLAANLVAVGQVRVNRRKVEKSAHEVTAGDVVTVVTGGRVRVLRVQGLGARRGPPAEARRLFEELTAPQTGHSAAQN